MNWDYAEPGVLFWDRIKDWNLLSNNDEFEYAGTNPCAEEPLPAGGSCLLGSINLSEFVIYPFKKNASFDFDGFRNAVKICVRALNDVLDEGLPLHPLQEQRDSVRDWRQIGLGVMGIGRYANQAGSALRLGGGNQSLFHNRLSHGGGCNRLFLRFGTAVRTVFEMQFRQCHLIPVLSEKFGVC